MSLLAVEERRSKTLLDDLNQKLEMLRVNKKEYDHFVKNQNLLDSIKYILYTRKEQHHKQKHKEVKENYDHGLKQQEAIEMDLKELEASKSNLEKEISRIKYSILHDDKAAAKAQQIEAQKEDKQADLQNRLQRNQTEITGYEKYALGQDAYKNELKKLHSAKLELLSQKNALETQIGIVSRLGKGGSFADVFKQDIRVLKSEISEVDEKIEAINDEISKISEEDARSSEVLMKLSKELEKVYQEVGQQSSNVQNCYARLSGLEAERDKLHNTLAGCERELNSKYFGTKSIKFGNEASKSYTGLQFYNTNRLIDNYRLQYPNKFISLVIDTVLIPDNLLLAFESLCANKLFSVVVETFEDADRLIELNRELKGGKLVVYVLEDYYRRKKQDKQIDEQSQTDYICLFKYLNLHPNLTMNISGMYGRTGRNSMQVERDVNITMDDLSEMQHNSTLNLHNTSINVDCLYNLLHTLFSSCYLVKTPELAAEFANRYQIDTVTADGDVFYNGGYITKVGYHKKSNKVLLHYEIAAVKQEIERLRSDLEQSESTYKTQQEIFDNESRELQRLEQQSLDQEAKIRIIKETSKSLKLRVLQLENSLFDYQKFRTQKLAALEEKQKLVASPDDYKASLGDVSTLEKALVSVNKKINALNDKLQAFEIKSMKAKQGYETPKQSIATVKKVHPERRAKRPSGASDRLRARREQLKEIIAEIDQKTSELHKVNRTQLAKREELKSSDITLAKLQYKIEKLREKAEAAEQYKKLNTKRLLEELKKLTTSSSHYFTEKDAVIFKKLAFINDKQQNYNEQLNNIEAGKQTVFNSFGKLTRHG